MSLGFRVSGFDHLIYRTCEDSLAVLVEMKNELFSRRFDPFGIFFFFKGLNPWTTKIQTTRL